MQNIHSSAGGVCRRCRYLASGSARCRRGQESRQNRRVIGRESHRESASAGGNDAGHAGCRRAAYCLQRGRRDDYGGRDRRAGCAAGAGRQAACRTPIWPRRWRRRRTWRTLRPWRGCFYVAYFKQDANESQRPITFLYNGGPGSSTVWLHMGSVGPKHVVTETDAHPAGGAVQAGGQSLFAAGRERSGVHRHAGHGLRPADGQRRGQGLLGRGSGRARVRAVHPAVPVQVQPLEFAEVPVWGELRDDAVGGAVEPAGERLQHRSERRDSAVADLQLHRRTSTGRI